MKRILSILICIMVISCMDIPAYAKSEYDIKVTKIDDSIAEIYPLFDGMRRFKAQNGRYGYLNEKYEVVIEPIYNRACDFKNSFAVVSEEGKDGVIDKSGKVIIPTEYREIEEFDENGIAIVKGDNDLKGFINDKGEVLTELKYSAMFPFVNGYATARVSGKEGVLLIDEDFNEIELPQYNWAMSGRGWIEGEDNIVENFDYKEGIVDSEHNLVVPYEYDHISYNYGEGDRSNIRYCVSNNNYEDYEEKGYVDYGYIDGNGNVIIPVIYDYLGDYTTDGLIRYILGNEGGLMDAYGNIVYNDVYSMHKKIYAIRENGVVTKYVDATNGNIRNKYDIDIVSPYVDGVALAMKRIPDGDEETEDYDELKYGLIDIYGNVIRDFDIGIHDGEQLKGNPNSSGRGMVYYSNPYIISDSLVAVRIDNKWGYMDLLGDIIIEPQFDEAGGFAHGYAEVELNDEQFFIDAQGNRCDNIDVFDYNEDHKFYYTLNDKYADIAFYFFYNLRPVYYREFSQFNNYHLFLDGEYGALKDEDTIILESDGDRIVDAKGNVLVENCSIEPYGEEGEKEHIAMYFTSDKNVLVKTADGNYIIEAEETETPDEIILTIGEKEAVFNGEPCENDVAPMIINERTMLPIRFVAEKLGARVSYIEKTNLVAVTLGDTQIAHIIGSDTAKVNGEEIALDVSSFTKNDRTYLPIRFIMENLGAEVEWLKDTNQVRITSK